MIKLDIEYHRRGYSIAMRYQLADFTWLLLYKHKSGNMYNIFSIKDGGIWYNKTLKNNKSAIRMSIFIVKEIIRMQEMT
jgi:hypothetical protein